MKRHHIFNVIIAVVLFCGLTSQKSAETGDDTSSQIEKDFVNPPYDKGPWGVWHWTSANQNKEGITSDLEGMAKAGIAGATLFSFPSGGFGSGGKTIIDNPAEPLSQEWFDLILHTVKEAKRLNIKLAIQISAGWATAGGDWIPPELSQQQIVWSDVAVDGGQLFSGKITRPVRTDGSIHGMEESHPKSWDNYYRDLNVLAYKVPEDWGENNITQHAKVSTSFDVPDIKPLLDKNNNSVVINSQENGFVQFEFEKPFTLRSIYINNGGSGLINLPAHSMEIQKSEDGITYTRVENLVPMMGGFQTHNSELTHAVKQTTARYFRLVYHPGPPVNYDEHMAGGTFTVGGIGPKREGDPVGFANIKDMIDPLNLAAIQLSSTAVVDQWQGKTALTWGKSRRVTNNIMPDSACIPLSEIIDISDKMDEQGNINWNVPKGKWRIIRFGYTTMARTNGSGIGQGLEPDKFSKEGARIAFKGWYERILDYVGEELSDSVITMLNVDSWECGSQNWSPVFKEEFEKRRGYDLTKYLPLMAGVPVQSADVTESFLFDIRRTIADLISDNFFGELQKLAHEKGDVINSEVTNPTMTSDGILSYKNVDQTSSEFWCDKWNCWKPCDIRDAASGAHIYGKKVVIAEAFTGGRNWKEDPYGLKAMGDMHYVDGINRMMIHVWAGQPYPDKKPGFTGPAGLYFNQNTPWIKPGVAWIDYMRRAQVLLQAGITECDALYFIGEDVPCRALLPENYGTYFAIDPVLPKGYNFDSVNQDAMLNLATVKDGKIVFPSGVSYSVLVLHPDRVMTLKLAKKLKELIYAGAQVVGAKPTGSISLEDATIADSEIKKIADEVWGDLDGVNSKEKSYGAGHIFYGLSMQEVMDKIGVEPDVTFLNQKETISGQSFKATADQREGLDATSYGPDRKGWGLMWNHRSLQDMDYYFISNQEQKKISADISIRQQGRIPEFWHADTGEIENAPVWKEENGRIVIPYDFEPSESVFIVFRKAPATKSHIVGFVDGDSSAKLKLVANKNGGLDKWAKANGNWILETNKGKTIKAQTNKVSAPDEIKGDWDVLFPLLTGEVLDVKMASGSWTENGNEEIKYFSGTATYKKSVQIDKTQTNKNTRLFLNLGDVKNMASVSVNGKNLGVIWKPPYKIEITNAVHIGDNDIVIEVSNTWYNRLVLDAGLPKNKKQTWLGTGIRNGGVRKDSELIPAGIIGPVTIETWMKLK